MTLKTKNIELSLPKNVQASSLALTLPPGTIRRLDVRLHPRVDTRSGTIA